MLSFQRCIAEKAVEGLTWKSHCSVSDRPNLGIIELELASLFGTGIAMSSWTWTSNTLQTWQKLWHRSLLIVTYCAGFNLQASADVAATEDVRIMARVQVLRP